MPSNPFPNLHITLLVLYSLLIALDLVADKASLFICHGHILLYLGMFLLLEVAVHLRHLRNVSLIREIRKNGGVDGQISYRKWFSYRIFSHRILYILCTSFCSSPC